MKTSLLLSIVLLTIGATAQQDAWVFFTEKENVTASLENPISILTQDALDRKDLHGIAIDERDVPVSENFISQIKNQPGITVLAKSKWQNCVHVRGELEAIEDLEALSIVSSIEYADKSLGRSSNGFGFGKEDPLLPQTRIDFEYGATDNQVTQIAVDALHLEDYTGEGMVIAVMDSGFPGVDDGAGFARLRDAGKLLDGYDFVDRTDDEFAFSNSSHGTRVLSDIVGFIQDDFVGTAPDATIYCFRTEDVNSENPVEESYWVEAAERADSLGVDVINTSLGYRTYDNPDYSHTYEDMDGITTFISRGATLAFEKGMMVVTSAGNSGSGMISAPADAEGAFTVGAVDGNGNYASFSSIGPSSDGRVKPDVMAKGQGSAVIDASGNITTNNGTSFSSPIMAGAVASFWQVDPTMTNTQVMQAIRESAHLFDNPTPQMGYGIPNFGDALASLSIEDPAFAKKISFYPNPAETHIEFKIPLGIPNAEILFFDILGKEVLNKTVTQEDTSADITTLNNGVYLIQIITNEFIVSQKLLKN